jgi:hypothetical protein
MLKILIIGLTVLAGLPTSLDAQGADPGLPLLTAGALPLYPMMARAARIQGVVKIRVSTDGKKVKSIDLLTGPPMLFEATKENIETWEFNGHKPASFVTTFTYRIEEPAQCSFSNNSIILHLPLEAIVTVKELETCDPSSTIQTVVPKHGGSKW